jgi:hypothetical protein
LAIEPAAKAPAEPEAVPSGFAAAAPDGVPDIAAAAGVAPAAAEPVPPAVLAAEGGATGGWLADAAAAVGAAGGEGLPDAGNWPPVDPGPEALFATALRAGLGAS